MEKTVRTPAEITLHPIGIIHSPRTEKEDDNWGDVISVIELDTTQFTEDVVAGLESFSHLEIVYFFHLVEPEKIETTARHPRNRTIFAQRAKGRPNRLGVSRCKLLKVEGLKLTVQSLDAIDGTPVLDIKPYMAEFGPIGEVSQPRWASELMTNYYA